ncbi:hypothetical protein [Shewanella xiamenensis]|uniref:hypothetical protein n=1 Tax=Shewanella xiamenensis TaxID=332186 RepID=UPI000849E6B7|nr:hypothetical protein [Shewanella xiamenensis]MDL3986886.1 hypothetical protein [Shewanella xiamenensis]ODR84590.1 hypothetical protein ABT47_04295 [Shewanella xiamenensis]
MFNGIKKNTIVSAYKPVEFPADTAEELAVALDIENIAKRMARQDLPPTDAQSIDAQELQFKQEMEKRAIQAKARIQQDAHFKEMEIANLSLERDLADLTALPETFSNTINREYQETESDLKELKAQYMVALDDLQAFKRQNGLRREADYPLSKTKAVGLLLLMLIIETILNANFFAQGSDLGFLGGAFQALVISVLNVSIGFMVGSFVLRWKNHISVPRRLLGLIGSIVFGTLALIGNLFVGHYRDAMSIDPDNGARVAVKQFLEGPFALQDFNSWVLVALGLIVFFIALYKGYTWDDVYPGFGQISRRVQNAKDELFATKIELTESIQDIYEAHVEDSEKYYKKMQKDKQQLEILFSSMKNDFVLYRNYLSNLKNAYQYLITLYRQTNKKERKSAPPIYFSENIIILLDELTKVQEPTDRRQQFDDYLTKAATDFPEIKNRLLKAQAEKIQLINEICKI